MSNEIETVQMIYAGRRATRKLLGYAWIEPGDGYDPTIFDKVKGEAVGYLYTMRVVRDENGRVASAYPNPTYTGDRYDDPEQVATWQAIDQAARADDRRRLAENRAKKAPELDAALDPLRAILHHAKNVDEADTILSLVRSKLLNEWARGKMS